MIISDGTARLLDIENFVLGVPSFYRPFFVQHSKIATAEHVDVYSFGHLMYEMSIGYPLQESVTRQPIECSESLSELFGMENFARNSKHFFLLFVFRESTGVDSIERSKPKTITNAGQFNRTSFFRRICAPFQRTIFGSNRFESTPFQIVRCSQRSIENCYTKN